MSLRVDSSDFLYDSADLFHLSASFCNEITDDEDEDDDEEADFSGAEPGHAAAAVGLVVLILVTDGAALTETADAADAGV
jgi:hypothetical protein